MERRIAVAAQFSSGGGGTQPMATSQALRIDTLHGPSRQILHVSPPGYSRDGSFPPWVPEPRNETEKSRGFSVDVLVVSRGKIQYLVVVLRRAQVQPEPAFDLGWLIHG